MRDRSEQALVPPKYRSRIELRILRASSATISGAAFTNTTIADTLPVAHGAGRSALLILGGGYEFAERLAPDQNGVVLGHIHAIRHIQ